MSESDESDEAFLKRIEERWSNLGGQYKQDAARIISLARRGITARDEALEEAASTMPYFSNYGLIVQHIRNLKDKP